MKLGSICFRLVGLFYFCSNNYLFIPAVTAEKTRPSTAVENLDKKPKKFCSPDLAREIEAVLNRPKLRRSRWGIEVQTLAGNSIYSLEGNKFFNPASAAKLLVSAAGLLELGADYRLKTPIYSQGKPPVLQSLRVKGQGDATISSQSLKAIVHQLRVRGVQQIEHLIIDDSYLAPPAINPTWEWVDVHSYFATAASSIILNENTVTLTLLPQQVGQPVKFFWDDAIAAKQWQVINRATTGAADIEYAVEIDGDLGLPRLELRGELAVNEPPDIWDLAVVDPAGYFLESLRLHLDRGGIKVNRGTVLEQADAQNKDTEFTAIYAPPLQEILQEINQESNNLYAEALGKILARKLKVDTSVEAIEQSLAEIGIKPAEYELVDSSGLSRQNLVTPQTLVKLLQLMSQESTAQSYRQTLAVAGVRGTLKRRFLDSSLQNKIWGKTGTLTGVGALSGYLERNNSTLVFCILVNNSELKNKEIRQAIDEIVAIVNRIDVC